MLLHVLTLNHLARGPSGRTVELVKKALLGLAALLLALGASSCGTTEPSEALSAEALTEHWLHWAAASPEGENPVTDTSGAWASAHQPGDVWFLAGAFGGQVQRDVAGVPAGTPVFVPALNQACFAAECDPVPGVSSAWVRVDAVEVELHEATTGTFELEGAQGNAFTGTSAGARVVPRCLGGVARRGARGRIRWRHRRGFRSRRLVPPPGELTP